MGYGYSIHAVKEMACPFDERNGVVEYLRGPDDIVREMAGEGVLAAIVGRDGKRETIAVDPCETIVLKVGE